MYNKSSSYLHTYMLVSMHYSTVHCMYLEVVLVLDKLLFLSPRHYTNMIHRNSLTFASIN